MAARLTGKTWCLTFITVGEMIQWARLRNWSPRNEGALSVWLSDLIMIGAGWDAARTWGRMSAEGKRRGRTYPLNDSWTAACCLTEGLPLATLNTKDFAEIAEHHGLVLVG
jgi:predicted nucleic acid-binding protein